MNRNFTLDLYFHIHNKRLKIATKKLSKCPLVNGYPIVVDDSKIVYIYKLKNSSIHTFTEAAFIW